MLIQGALNVAKTKGANIHNAVPFSYCFAGAAVLELARSGANFKGSVVFGVGMETPKGKNYLKPGGNI